MGSGDTERRSGLVGRAAFMAPLEELAATLVTGDGGAACLVGPPGIGKSALARAFAATLDDWTVIVGRCAPPPAAPWRALAEVAVAAIGEGADLDAVDQSVFGMPVRTLLGVGAPVADAGHQGLMMGEGLRRLMTSCATQPLLCILEDLHWADDETLDVLDYLVDHLDDATLMLLVTMRDHESPATTATVEHWQRRGVARTLTLPPLDRDGVDELIQAVVGGSAPASFLDAVAGAGEGNPLLIEEFTREALATGALTSRGDAWSFDLDVDLAIPSNYRAAVRRRVDALTPEVRANVQLAALVGRAIDPNLLTRLGVDADEAEAAGAEAIRVQLAEPGLPDGASTRFRHALTRDAVVATLSEPDRTELASSALRTLEADPLDDRDLEAASQLAVAAGDSRRGGELLIEAARRAVDRGTAATALARLDAAESLADAEALHGPVIRELRVEAMALAGRAGDALELGEQLVGELESSRDEIRLHRIQLALARASGSLGDWVGAANRLDDAVADVDQAPAPVASFRAIAAIELGDIELATRVAASTLDRDDADGVAVCEAREVLGRVARETSYLAAAEHFRAGVAAATDAGLDLWRARSLLELGLSEATVYGKAATFELARQSAVSCGAMSLSAMVDYNLANLSGLRFETAKALDAATRCIETARQLGARRLEALGWVTAGQAHGNRGDRGKARLAADEARRALPGDPETEGLAAGMCESWAALMMGDVDGAAEGYGRSLETLAALPVPTATAPWYVGTTLLAAVDHPFAGTARARLEAPSFRAATGLGAVSTLIDAVVAGRTAGAAEADELLVEVRRHHRQHPELIANLAGLWHVLWATVASAELRDGWGRPIEDLKQAEQWLQDHGSEPAARWCASQLRSAGIAPRRRGRSRADVPDILERFGVTKREHEVLLLLGERLTNREIADRMTVSPSTVKSHVERLLAKTGRRNRIELAELATATDGE